MKELTINGVTITVGLQEEVRGNQRCLAFSGLPLVIIGQVTMMALSNVLSALTEEEPNG